jgi:hypothetical protein
LAGECWSGNVQFVCALYFVQSFQCTEQQTSVKQQTVEHLYELTFPTHKKKIENKSGW